MRRKQKGSQKHSYDVTGFGIVGSLNFFGLIFLVFFFLFFFFIASFCLCVIARVCSGRDLVRICRGQLVGRRALRCPRLFVGLFCTRVWLLWQGLLWPSRTIIIIMGKRKFEPSDDLKKLLLELAGIEDASKLDKKSAGEAQAAKGDDEELPSVEVLRAEATELKRRADKTAAPLKYVFYIRSSIRYLQMLPALKKATVEVIIAHLGSTAGILEFAADQCLSKVKHALTSNDLGLLEQYAHLAALAYKLATVTRLQRYYCKTDKLKRCLDAVKAIDSKKRKSHGFLSEEDQRADTGYRTYIASQGEDSILAMDHWRKAEKLAVDTHEMHKKCSSTSTSIRIDQLPPITGLMPEQGLDALLRTLRKALDVMYPAT